MALNLEQSPPTLSIQNCAPLYVSNTPAQGLLKLPGGQDSRPLVSSSISCLPDSPLYQGQGLAFRWALVGEPSPLGRMRNSGLRNTQERHNVGSIPWLLAGRVRCQGKLPAGLWSWQEESYFGQEPGLSHLCVASQPNATPILLAPPPPGFSCFLFVFQQNRTLVTPKHKIHFPAIGSVPKSQPPRQSFSTLPLPAG